MQPSNTNKVLHGETICLHRWQFDGCISTVQPPSECSWSGAGDGFVAMLISEFDFQRWGSSNRIIALKCSVVVLEAHGQTEGQTNRSIA